MADEQVQTLNEYLNINWPYFHIYGTTISCWALFLIFALSGFRETNTLYFAILELIGLYFGYWFYRNWKELVKAMRMRQMQRGKSNEI